MTASSWSVCGLCDAGDRPLWDGEPLRAPPGSRRSGSLSARQTRMGTSSVRPPGERICGLTRRTIQTGAAMTDQVQYTSFDGADVAYRVFEGEGERDLALSATAVDERPWSGSRSLIASVASMRIGHSRPCPTWATSAPCWPDPVDRSTPPTTSPSSPHAQRTPPHRDRPPPFIAESPRLAPPRRGLRGSTSGAMSTRARRHLR